MTATVCPFCGVVTDVPHETQQGCIDALQLEISRVRGILAYVTTLPFPEDLARLPNRPNR